MNVRVYDANIYQTNINVLKTSTRPYFHAEEILFQ